MQKKVEEEGEKQEKLFKKFQCYCKTGGGALAKSIAEAGVEAPELESQIKESESKKTQIEEDLKSHQSDRAAAKTAIAEATAIREKAAKDYGVVKSDADANIAAMTKAIAALEKGMAGFIQTTAASSVKRIVLSRQSMAEVDRQDVLAFLSGDSQSAPQGGQITGILKELNDQMKADLKGATADENAAIADFNGLVAAKKKEIAALTASIESKTARGGDLAVEIVQLKDSLSDTQAALLEDKKYLADLEKNCDSKAAEWDEIQKTRSEELLALADTIRILNDDDALDLFKKTLPSASAALLQVADSTEARRSHALSLVQAAKKKFPNKVAVDFISLALSGKKIGFEKVITMIDEMVGTLKQEQTDDDDKKEYCGLEFDNVDDKKKALVRKSSDLEATIADAEDGISKAKEQIASLTASIAALDKSVAEASAQRKEEHAAFSELMTSNGAAKQLIGIAKNRMNKFYNPKLYKPPPARELTEEQRITVNMGGTLAPTPPPGGIAGTGVTALVQIRAHKTRKDAPAPPPETFSGYTQKGESNNGVMAMLDLLVKDLDKEMQEAEVDEENAQKEYEEMMADSAAKRQQDSKRLTDTGATKANLESELQEHKDSADSTSAELMATEKYISSLHGECDWLVKYFDARKEARAGEIDALNNAKAVLSGADYSLIQAGSLRGTRRQ